MQNQDSIIQEIIAKQAEITALFDLLKEASPNLFPNKKQSKRFEIPTMLELRYHIQLSGYNVDPEQFHAFYSSKNWMVGKNKMKCWKSALVTWNKRAIETHQGGIKQKNGNPVNWNDQNFTFMDSMMSEDF